MHLKLLITPLAKGAWFEQRVEVAEAELTLTFPGVTATVDRRPSLELLDVELPEATLPRLARLSFLQAAFEVDGDCWRALDLDPGFLLPEQLVSSASYRGKTNELVTALALNVALCVAGEGEHKLLDPVAGRGTTLLCAARYGIEARGVERDPKALDDLRRIVKKQTKLHRIPHKLTEGSVRRRSRDGSGGFLQFDFEHSAVRLVTGDSSELPSLLRGERFSLVVGDLPYGIQHVGRGGTRNPLKELAACAPGWAASLRPGGAMVLVFNALQPRREVLTPLFTDNGLVEIEVRASHRMSESIQRELAVFRKPPAD